MFACHMQMGLIAALGLDKYGPSSSLLWWSKIPGLASSLLLELYEDQPKPPAGYIGTVKTNNAVGYDSPWLNKAHHGSTWLDMTQHGST